MVNVHEVFSGMDRVNTEWFLAVSHNQKIVGCPI